MMWFGDSSFYFQIVRLIMKNIDNEDESVNKKKWEGYC